MITTSRVNFRYGTQEGYLRSNIDQNTVYFLTDVGKIFKGTKDVTTNIVPVGESFPPVSEAIVDKFYIHVNTLEVRIKAGLSWKVLSPGYISDDCDWADLSSDDKLVTKKVIKNKIAEMMAGIVDGFSYDPETGSVCIGTARIQLTGLVDDITYDRNNLQISIHEIGSDERILIDLPKDNYIQDFRFVDRYLFEDGTIGPALVLIVKAGQAPTHEVAIPTKAFTDIYTGESTKTVEVSVSSDNKISASVIVSQYRDSDDNVPAGEDVPKLLFQDKDGNIIARPDRSWKAVGEAISLAVSTAQQALEAQIAALAEHVDTILGPGDAGDVVVSGSSGEVLRSDLPVNDVRESIYWSSMI